MPSQLKAILTTLLLLTTSSLASLSPHLSPPTPGCSGTPHPPGFHDTTTTPPIHSGNLTRTYAIYIPPSYAANPHHPHPLILDYHGNNGNPLNQYNNSRYFDIDTPLGQGQSYIAVYPAGMNGSWQSAPYAVEGVDDVRFTGDLLDHLRREYCIDTTRIYASGKSNGGGFVDYLACSDVGDQFAAFAMSSAALYSDNGVAQCNNSKPRAILESHGGNDSTISYLGGPRSGGFLPDVREWIGWWAVRDGCAADCEDCKEVEGENGYEVLRYDCGGLEDVVVHYEVFELGHCWPSSTGENSDSARSYCGDRSLDFTSVVLEFFGRWRLGSGGVEMAEGWRGWRT